MKLNRSIPPEIHQVEKIELLDVEANQLSNGSSLYFLSGGNQPVISIQIICNAGRWQEQKRNQAMFASQLITDGTKNKTSKQISELIDFHGAYLQSNASYDYSTIQLLSLSKYIEVLIPELIDMLQNPIYPQEELDILRANKQQNLRVNLQKTDSVAQRKFHQNTFGENHPYGYASTIEDYDHVIREDLISLHQSHINTAPISWYVAGNMSKNQKSWLTKQIEEIPFQQEQVSTSNFEIIQNKGIHKDSIKDAQQTTIRIGKPTITTNQADFTKLLFTNTCLGGYFGSRLMQNLREDKGFTYGISSRLGSFKHSGYWMVGTDVGTENAENAVHEIYLEIKKLQTDLISDQELELVQNVMLGKYLSKVDGPFSQLEVLQNLHSHGQTAKDFHKRIEEIKEIKPKDVRDMAQKYWTKDSFTEVLVG